jgi:hypothetical protein
MQCAIKLLSEVDVSSNKDKTREMSDFVCKNT